jgi:hypothetical protein
MWGEQMFPKIIHIDNVKDIRYGTTEIGFYQTKAQLDKLLDKHGCTKVISGRDGTFNMIGFEYQEKSYMLAIPNVYVKGVLVERLGIRIVFRYLEVLLELAKERVIDLDFALLSAKMVQTSIGTMTVGKALEKMPQADLMLPEYAGEDNDEKNGG